MRNLIRHTMAMLVVGVGVVGQAWAAPVAYNFTGTLTDIRRAGAGLAYGTAFSATYVHDDAAQIGQIIDPARYVYLGGALHTTAGQLALSSGPSTNLQVFDSWTNAQSGYVEDDGYFVSAYVYDVDPRSFYLVQFDLWDFSGQTLNSVEMPSQQQFQSLAQYGRFWIRRFEDGIETGLAQGRIQEVVPLTVQEPSAIALLGLGLAVFAANIAARRKRVGV